MGLDVPPGTPNLGPSLMGMSITLTIIVVVFTLLRIISMFVVKRKWWWDDFFAIYSLPHQVALFAVIIAWTNIGLGLHADEVMKINPELMIEGAKHLYACVFLFDCSIQLPKIAALFFYARVFRSNNKAFTIHLWIAGFLVAGWLISALIATVFQCTPIAKAWNSGLDGHCIDNSAWYIATATISTLTDFYILLLPVPMIWGLKISLKRRIYLLAAFMLSYSVIVLSIGRLVMTIRIAPTLQLDLTWNMAQYFYWVCLEGVFSIISINMPAVVALVKLWFSPCFPGTISEGSGGKQYNGTGTAATYGSKATAYRSRNGDREGFERLESAQTPGSDNDSQTGLKPMDTRNPPVELGKIHVRTDLHVQHDGTDRY